MDVQVWVIQNQTTGKLAQTGVGPFVFGELIDAMREALDLEDGDDWMPVIARLSVNGDERHG